MHIPSKKAGLLALSIVGLSIAPAGAVNPNFAAGDLVLYFEQFGGSQTLMLDLGAAYTYRALTANRLNIANIGGSLTGSTGSGGMGLTSTWYDDPTVFWGIAGVLSNSTQTSTQTNGDPSRTLYISQPRDASVGTAGVVNSTGWGPFGNTSMTNGASGMISQNNRLGTIPTSGTDRLVEGTGTSNVDNQNPFNIAGNPGTAYSIFPGGVMSSFSTGTYGTLGGVAAESALDLYRIVATNNPAGTVPGTLNTGDFQGSFVIDNTGSVSFIAAPVPEPATVSLLATGAVFGLVRRRRVQRA